MLTFGELKKEPNVSVHKKEFKGKSVFLAVKPLKTGVTLRMGPRSYTVFNDAFLVIIDEVPFIEKKGRSSIKLEMQINKRF